MVHIPKTAGTALGAALERATGADGGSPWQQSADLDGIREVMAANDLRFRRRVYTPQHARAVDIRDALGAAVWRGLHSVAILRDPYARMASSWHFIRMKPNNPLHDFCTRTGLAQYIVLNCLCVPQLQADWVMDPAGNCIVSRLYHASELDLAARDLGQRLGAVVDLRVENDSANRRGEPARAFDGVPDWVVDLFHQTYAADFALTGARMDADRVRQSTNPGSDTDADWQALTREIAPRMARLSARNIHLERQLSARVSIADEG